MLETINIAIVGFGNIGSYFYKVLEKNRINISVKTGQFGAMMEVKLINDGPVTILLNSNER